MRWGLFVALSGLLAGCATRYDDGIVCAGAVGETLCEVARPSVPEGLSDITHIGENNYWCVDDRGGLLHELEIVINRENGFVDSCRVVRSIALEGRQDLEGCALDPLDGRVWVSDESDTSVRQFDPETGVETATASIPEVFSQNVGNDRSFEALTITQNGRRMYVANEDTLTCDGPFASQTQKGLVRILELTRTDEDEPWTPARQFRYRTEKIEGKLYKGWAISGVVAMAATPEGTLYVLEREMSRKNPFFPTFRASLYEVRPEGTDGAELTKRLVWTEDTAFSNHEGCCFGPRLTDGTPTLILISDGGGPAAETVRVLALRHGSVI